MMKDRLKKFDITPIQYGVLQCIWQLDMHNPKEIAQYLSVENSTISGILERMENKDLIVRTIDESDRRFIKIYLTDKSRDLELPVNKVVEEVNKDVMAIFSEEEEKQLKKYLKRISTL